MAYGIVWAIIVLTTSILYSAVGWKNIRQKAATDLEFEPELSLEMLMLHYWW